MMRNRSNSGFTLIELMIAVAVLGILVAIAYPSYTNYIVKANRAFAKSFLMEVAQKQQQYLLDNRGYAATAADLKLDVANQPTEFKNFYTLDIDVDAGPPPGFTVTATPKAGTRQAGDGDLVINNKGEKTPADKW